MAQAMYKHDAMLHLVWIVATADRKPGEEKSVTPEENSYINTIRRTEGIKIDWDDFSSTRKKLGYNKEAIIDEACKALRGCGRDWKIKCLGYMQRMGWVSNEGGYKDDLEQNISEKEWNLILRAQRELGLTKDERKNSYKSLPRK